MIKLATFRHQQDVKTRIFAAASLAVSCSWQHSITIRSSSYWVIENRPRSHTGFTCFTASPCQCISEPTKKGPLTRPNDASHSDSVSLLCLAHLFRLWPTSSKLRIVRRAAAGPPEMASKQRESYIATTPRSNTPCPFSDFLVPMGSASCAPKLAPPQNPISVQIFYPPGELRRSTRTQVSRLRDVLPPGGGRGV